MALDFLLFDEGKVRVLLSIVQSVFRMNIPVMDPRVKRQGGHVVIEAAQVLRNHQLN